MSQHPSLRCDSVGTKHRNVLKRLERIKRLEKENRWNENSKIFGLPKVKCIKIKVKKSSEGKEAKDATKEAGATTASAASAADKKPAEKKG